MTFDLLNAEDFPFLHYAEDEKAYDRSRSFWLMAFLDTMGSEAERWHRWMADPFADGHPMFSAIDHTGNRGVLLQQVLKTEDPVWFKCWMSTSAGFEGRPIAFLFVETFISLQSREFFDDLILAWCRERRSVDALTQLTDSVRRRATESFDAIDFGWPRTEGPALGR